jgi:hypothetical protein
MADVSFWCELEQTTMLGMVMTSMVMDGDEGKWWSKKRYSRNFKPS